jgi:hypothetical protein
MANEVLTNPYNQVGTLHNQGLDYLIDYLSNQPTTDELARLSAQFVCINGLGIPNPTDFDTGQYYAAASYAMNSYLCNDIARKPESFTNIQLNYFNKISKTIQDSSDRFSIRPDLEALEFEIMRSEISWKEQVPMLIAIAVGKYSADYWNYQIDNIGSSKWATYINQYGNPSTEMYTWVETDIQAFITTVIVELVLPGGQTLLATAVVTSLASSAASTIWGWLKGIFS